MKVTLQAGIATTTWPADIYTNTSAHTYKHVYKHICAHLSMSHLLCAGTQCCHGHRSHVYQSLYPPQLTSCTQTKLLYGTLSLMKNRSRACTTKLQQSHQVKKALLPNSVTPDTTTLNSILSITHDYHETTESNNRLLVSYPSTLFL